MKSTDTLTDTGFLVALFHDGDRHHADARRMLQTLAGSRLYTVWEVLTEAGHLLDDVGRLNLMRWTAAGRLTVLASDPATLGAMADFMERYADGGADLADVALVFAADRMGIYNILTVDRKDFDRYRSPNGRKLKRLWLKD
ncbi:MAG: tRNA(fMet)-specific endonuclease VapC [Paracidovorax wautersii]|uniref:tRNA(fMet)-specific endonuclease VapC n=1 Tax=Paracidovorax wautersii TaxID=1177982 RepID=A0A7V8FRK2_9BURK|nr:MAG: tRNA(fMet)-specific endonuclease VapC [Paracidovorax wautersii]